MGEKRDAEETNTQCHKFVVDLQKNYQPVHENIVYTSSYAVDVCMQPEKKFLDCHPLPLFMTSPMIMFRKTLNASA